MIENKVYKEDEVSVLTPFTKNYHQIIALEDSALLDVLVPDYGNNDCNYYKVTRSNDKRFFTWIPN